MSSTLVKSTRRFGSELDNNLSAAQRVAKYKEEMARMMQLIAAEIESYGKGDEGNLHWGHVGDVAGMHEDLYKVAGQLGLAGEDWDAEL